MNPAPEDVGIPPEIACPVCREPIRARDAELVCAQHGPVGRRGADTAFVFADEDAYWGEIERDRMRQVNADARVRGWPAAVQQHLAQGHADLLPYVQHPARADWRVLFPLDRERTVSLDVGAGWGAISFGLAPHVRRHYALERVPERLEFIGIRKVQDGASNVVPIRADLHAVPLRPACLDLVAVNGVLEWAGLVDPVPHRVPREPGVLQEEFLRQLCSLLRPGGRLYVGIENRYGRMFWRGTPDHQGLRFTSLMPRAMARAYTRWRAARSPRTFLTENDYRTWTYSLRGTRRLLERCGFQDVRAYAVVPGYNAPMQIVPLADPSAFVYLATRLQSSGLGSLRRAARVAASAIHLEAHITSCFAFTARVPELRAR